jgi:carnitine-CoA ligase
VTFTTVPGLVAAAAERFRHQIALRDKASVETFCQLAERAGAAAGALREWGGRPGDRVILLGNNSIPLIHVWLGAIQAGLLPAAINPDLTGPELDYIGGDLEPTAVVSCEGSVESGAELAARLGVRHLLASAIGDAGAAPEPHHADPLAPAAIVYTSGTTNRPKGVLVRHAAYTESGRAFPDWVGLRETERLWACLPFFHLNAQAYSLMTCLANGYPLALSERFHASTFWSEARVLEVTAVNVIGAMLTFLERQPQESWVAGDLRTIYAAPAPPPERRMLLESRFRLRITGGYGMTENTFGCSESPTSREKPSSIGRPRQPHDGVFVNELRIVAADEREAAVGERGELQFRNPVVTPGYWHAEEITKRVLVAGWLRTGDAGYLDADGDVILAGRFKEMIRRRGENIAPGEVEDALLLHPAVEAAAVFGVPSDVGDEEVVAVVVLVAGTEVDAETLREHARGRLAAFKVPSAIVFHESLPMTATARVAKDRLRERYLRK